jgi:hypothetical protein
MVANAPSWIIFSLTGNTLTLFKEVCLCVHRKLKYEFQKLEEKARHSGA